MRQPRCSTPISPTAMQATMSRYPARIFGFSHVEKTRLESSGNASPSTHFIDDMSMPKMN